MLSYSGHIASLVNPPGNPKAHYWTGGPPGPDPQDWLADATKHGRAAGGRPGPSGSRRTPASARPPRGELGSTAHPVLDPAPGRYVRDRT